MPKSKEMRMGFQQYIQDLVDKELKRIQNNDGASCSGELLQNTPIKVQNVSLAGKTTAEPNKTTEMLTTPTVFKSPGLQTRPQPLTPNPFNNTLKSPSADTIYEPAARQHVMPGASSPHLKGRPQNNVDYITKFINDVRLGVTTNQEPTESDSSPENRKEQETVNKNRARQLAEEAVADAEKYKAGFSNKGNKPYITVDEIDDKFFHIACHVEPQLRIKCTRGEFVELEKLLQQVIRSQKANPDEQKFELVTRNGQTYVTPQEKDAKITNVRKWEQAFRIYANLYSTTNPHRSAEIWQYVDVIHTAASSFAWDNVARYDLTFRHLMAANPERSWARIYTQGWSLNMRDPVQFRSAHSSTNHFSNAREGKVKNKSRYCWRFNKNKCKFGDTCRYEHKCSYCDGIHGAINCPKKTNKKDERSDK